MNATRPDNQRPLLLVAVPCLNEEQTVARVVRDIPREIKGIGRVEVVVFDDGSTDATADRARDAGAEVVSSKTNQGLGATFRDAVRVALSKGADIMVHIDGDGQFDPADIPLLIGPVISNQADMVTASRFLDRSLTPEMPLVKRWGNRSVAFIVRLLSGENFKDVSCGFRAFSKETLLRMNLFGRFTYTQESFLDLIFKKLTILEIPVSVRGVREFGESRVASSIPRYAIRSLAIMFRAFISYKPFKLFFAIASVFLVVGVALLGFLGMHYLETGAFSPHIWAGFVGGSFSFFGFTTLITGLIGDMLVRMRLNQEEILYQLKRSRLEGRDSLADSSMSIGKLTDH
ncbi:MAG: glycosyltransferase family 2 protein [Woeseia sp.]|nr:glycosyltransferase family 2 protein [Woeseia sp.]MBT6211348.1 glycosyltransferase family 2 protein [Woeseia sp.]